MPSFLADAMLGDIARKLRIFGYDTLYIKDTSDSCVLQTALREKRVLLTRDKELFKRVVKSGIQGILLEGYDEIESIAYTLLKYKINCISFSARTARCSLCNGILRVRTSTDVKGALPKNITKIHNRFFQCSECDKAYWEGSHISSLHTLAEKINNKIKKSCMGSSVDCRVQINKTLKSPRNKTNTILNEQKSRVGKNSQQGSDAAARRVYSSNRFCSF